MFRRRSVVFMLTFTLLFFFLHLSYSLADDVNGTINEDTTWVAADSPYIVSGNIKIIEGVVLTIQPGVMVVFQEGMRSETGFYIRVDGTLNAQGTKTAPIIFTAQNKTFPWGGIVFTDISEDWNEGTSTGCIIDHCIIEYAGNSTIYGTAAISTFSAQPYLGNNTIRYTSSIGISATDILTVQSPSGRLQVVGNHIHNHAEGIRLALEGALIENNYFIDNNQAIVVQTSSNDITIRNNTIVNTREDVQGDGISLSLETVEDDSGIAEYFWEQTSGQPIEIDNPGSPFATFIAPFVGASVETLVFNLTVTDDDGQTDSESLEITIYGTNQPPVANAGADQRVQQGRNVVLSAAGSSDPDDGIKSYRWVQTEGPDVTLSSTSVMSPTFPASANVPDEGATFRFQVTVTDWGDLQDTDTVDILVYKDNSPPIADAGDDFLTVSGVLVQLDGSNSIDPDGGIISYSWDQTAGPLVILEGADTAKPRFLTPAVGMPEEELIFEITVEDAGNPKIETKDTVSVTVFGEKIPPFAVTENAFSIMQGETARLFALNSYDSDRLPELTIENNLLSSTAETAWLINISQAFGDADYRLNITANQFNILSENGLALYLYNWLPGILDPDIRLTDNWWGSTADEDIERLIYDGADDFMLPEIDADPADSVPDGVGSTMAYPPMANAGADISAAADMTVKLNGTGTYDPDNIATYAWTQLDGPAVKLKGSGSDSPSFIAPLGGNEGASLTFQLRVSIDGAFYDTDDVVVNIVPDAETTTVEHGDFFGCFITSIR